MTHYKNSSMRIKVINTESDPKPLTSMMHYKNNMCIKVINTQSDPKPLDLNDVLRKQHVYQSYSLPNCPTSQHPVKFSWRTSVSPTHAELLDCWHNQLIQSPQIISYTVCRLTLHADS